jgi:biopolymer transport protein ExbB/TolQ
MSKLARNLLVAGLLLTFIFPAVGLVGTVFFMLKAFHDLGQNGISDPSLLAHHIGNVLVVTAVGAMFIIPGIGLLIGAGCVIYGERRKGVQ